MPGSNYKDAIALEGQVTHQGIAQRWHRLVTWEEPTCHSRRALDGTYVRFLPRRTQALRVANMEYEGVMTMGYDIVQQH